MKICKRCSKEKPLDCFYKALNKEGRCKECVSEMRKAEYAQNPQKHRDRVNLYRNENPEKIRDTKLKQAYGVGVDYFNAKLKEQGGVCVGCKQDRKIVWRGKETAMALDHDHETGNPRGVLCIKCNRALGLLEENPESFQRLIEYINKYKKVG